ncbi:cell division protein FtsK [Campylobacter upsaliensis]|uniref:Cell division protein FtsK n=1 Tax=Campylobacter upsaliensis TaxID=28080 RepID=A0A5M1DLB0_CAMUP|nr:DNA translocase FtsK [Campylobacter upsaliensis]EAI2900142.1 cell division protein FtsK [Campylobacter upsaliensis]EAI9944074.1 cell division protein FtsK [Campylobacter upsaliensis]ECJ8453583.1 cell division protein FtsK [Campylobacter upsaliensis]ECV9715877.1 cell division protein FtsK [Campylobacter upsaliensis]ECV9717932.1 cell division protein FtsK [Campylobacter upsaliensis]
MLAPQMGVWLYEFNFFLFGEFGIYYPFALFVLNYLYFKKSYKIELFKRTELFGISFAFFATLLLFAVFDKHNGYILELLYALFSILFGHIGSGIVALLFLLLSICLLFPNFIKEVFKIEIKWERLAQFESNFKNILMKIFGGESEKEEFAEIKTKSKEENAPSSKMQNLKPAIEEEIKTNNLKASSNAKADFAKLKTQILDEKIEIENLNPQSFLYENSKELRSFAQKASKSVMGLDEEFNFIPQEEMEVIPERFLKPKKPEDIQQIDIKDNLDEPSYKRKNIAITPPKNETKPKIFTKELETRENLMQKARLEKEYKENQNEILEKKVQEQIQRLENEELKNLSPLPTNSKYSFNEEATSLSKMPEIQNTPLANSQPQADNSDFEIIELKENLGHDVEFVVEELESPIMPPKPSVIKLEDVEEKNEKLYLNDEAKKPLKEDFEITLEENLPQKRSILAKEIAINQALLAEIEQGDFENPKDFILPPLDFLANPDEKKREIDESEIDKKIYDLLEKLRRFKIGGDVISTYTGPVVTTFEFRPSADVKVSRILNLQDDLAMALKARSIRIQAPIPGKDVVGIEVPNEETQTIYLREILESEVFRNSKSPLTITLGKDIVGNAFVTDLKKLPHLLIAGTTGSGKSVGINAMLLSLLYRNSPKTLRLMMIDPKMLEFSIYNDIPHLLTPVITDPKKAVNALSNMVAEMERRYRLMAEAKTKNIENYNEKVRLSGEAEELPFIVVIIDELADLMMTAGKDVEFYIGRLAQMARASGIHLIVATQRPSVDVVTGLIKANLPSRISYKVGQKIDSKVILDAMGAESLLGRGDCLFTPPGTSNIVRLHAPFASEFEIEKIVDFLKEQQLAEYDDSFLKDEQSSGVTANGEIEGGLDELFEEAKRVILEDKKTSISYLQRRLKIGYNRAANIIEQLSQMGILSEPDSKGQREIL